MTGAPSGVLDTVKLYVTKLSDRFTTDPSVSLVLVSACTESDTPDESLFDLTESHHDKADMTSMEMMSRAIWFQERVLGKVTRTLRRLSVKLSCCWFRRNTSRRRIVITEILDSSAFPSDDEALSLQKTTNSSVNLHENVKHADILSYLGLEIGMSFIGLGRIANYWSTKHFLRQPDFTLTMSAAEFSHAVPGTSHGGLHPRNGSG